jgi:hypothetical protein
MCRRCVYMSCSLSYRRPDIMNCKFQVLNSGGWTIRPPATWNALPQHQKPLFYWCLLLFRFWRLWFFLLHMKHANYYLTCLFVYKDKGRHGGKAAHILDFRTRWKWMVRFMFWPLLTPWKELPLSQYLYDKLSWLGLNTYVVLVSALVSWPVVR